MAYSWILLSKATRLEFIVFSLEKLFLCPEFLVPSPGVATIVQGTIVQGDCCPRDFCPRDSFPSRLLSKETFVQGIVYLK